MDPQQPRPPSPDAPAAPSDERRVGSRRHAQRAESELQIRLDAGLDRAIDCLIERALPRPGCTARTGVRRVGLPPSARHSICAPGPKLPDAARGARRVVRLGPAAERLCGCRQVSRWCGRAWAGCIGRITLFSIGRGLIGGRVPHQATARTVTRLRSSAKRWALGRGASADGTVALRLPRQTSRAPESKHREKQN